MADKNQVVGEYLLQAPAKINLILKVVGRRDDGYHELETWMQKLKIYDTIRLQIMSSPGIELSCSCPDVPNDSGNLLWQAADIYLSLSKRATGKGVRLHLEKKIPVAAGLGGGSSNAGTLLKCLNHHFKGELDNQTMLGIAKSLGADVPFFVTDMESVIATGIGEKMVPVNSLSDCTFIVVNPGVTISTAEVFEKFALTRLNKNSTLTGSQKLKPENLLLTELQNDLESVTIEMLPVIDEIKSELKKCGADPVLMSGSGPTVFGVFKGLADEKKNDIAIAASRLRLKFGELVFTV